MKREEFFQAMDKLFENSDIFEIRQALEDIREGLLTEYWKQKSEDYAECEHCGALVDLSKCRKSKFRASVDYATIEIEKYYCPECGEVAFEEGAFV